MGERQLIDGIRGWIRIGSPWRNVPAEYGPWQTLYDLFRRLAARWNLGQDPGRVTGHRRRGRPDHLDDRGDSRNSSRSCAVSR
ncbi:transposase [Micromonospora sp. NPDC049175]|uniref:transposase n=1 Tax=Micromonospora sp. NPDC049175 TaxID=3364266 RepID=UPI0037140837